MMNTNRTLKLTTLALCGVINILGGTIALLLRLPVYLDSIGTVLAAALFGPAAGLVPGLISGLISGMTSDVYAFYYIPVQLADATVIKRQMIAYFGKTIYYRCCNKERLIKPKEQEYIQGLFRRRGVTETPQFDEYIEYYDLG